MKLEFYTTVTKGQLTKTWESAVNSFEGQRVKTTIEKFVQKRTNPQNAYFHGVVIPICNQGFNDLGHRFNAKKTKENLKKLFLKEDLPLKDGLFIESVKGTSELSTEEMAAFIEQVKQFAAEFLGVYIPDANEQLEAF